MINIFAKQGNMNRNGTTLRTITMNTYDKYCFGTKYFCEKYRSLFFYITKANSLTVLYKRNTMYIRINMNKTTIKNQIEIG